MKDPENVPQLKAVKLDMDDVRNVTHPLIDVHEDDIFLILGEVEDFKHYILYRFWSSVGNEKKIMSGMYEMYRFKSAKEDV